MKRRMSAAALGAAVLLGALVAPASVDLVDDEATPETRLLGRARGQPDQYTYGQPAAS